MDLRELIPEVPGDVQVLNSGSKGIYVVTLQLWLKMLGYDCGNVDGQFGLPVKEQVLKFKKDQLNEVTDDEKVDFTVWKAMDELLKDKLPPDPETLERLPFPLREDYETDEAYAYAVRMGLEAFGFRPEVQEGEYLLEIDESGFGILDNIPAGIYSLEMDNNSTKQTSQLDYNEEAGSMEVRLYDENEEPISGKVKLTNETPEPESLRKTIRLFKALAREVDVLEDKHGKEVNPKTIDGKFYSSNKKMWEDFPTSWGQFYGAPWMGTMFDPTTPSNNTVNPSEINWAMFETIKLLYTWGKKHTERKDDSNYGLMAVRHLNHAKGGNTIIENLIDIRPDFSQIGQSISLQIPRKTSRKFNGTETGQMYGGIDYDSDEYNRDVFELMFSNLISLNSQYEIRCPDEMIVKNLNSDRLIHDSYPSNSIVNSTISKIKKSEITINQKLASGNILYPVVNARVYLIFNYSNKAQEDDALKKLNNLQFVPLNPTKDEPEKYYLTSDSKGIVQISSKWQKNKNFILYIETELGYSFSKQLRTLNKNKVVINANGTNCSALKLSEEYEVAKFDIGKRREKDTTWKSELNAERFKITNRLKEGEAISLGLRDDTYLGQIILEFNPHLYLVHKNQPIFRLIDYLPSESYDLWFGNDPANVNVDSNKLYTKGGYSFFSPIASDENISYKYVRIRDNTKSTETDKNNTPGFDFRSPQGYIRKVKSTAFAILVDVSGSMDDNDNGGFYRTRGATSPNQASYSQRLYINSIKALYDKFKDGSLGSKEKIRFYTFHYNSLRESMIQEWTNGTLELGSVLDIAPTKAGLGKYLNNKGFTDYTPLAKALKVGVTMVNSIDSECKVMIVITDGDGSSDYDQEFTDALTLDGKGIIELIGYKLHPKEVRGKFHSYKPTGWMVYPHEVNSKTELEVLLEKLKIKYGI